jgi:hypothetical protein
VLWKITKFDIRNSEQCKVLKPKNLLNFFFLWSFEYNLFCDEIWHVAKTQYYLHTYFFTGFFEILKYHFRILKKRIHHSVAL